MEIVEFLQARYDRAEEALRRTERISADLVEQADPAMATAFAAGMGPMAVAMFQDPVVVRYLADATEGRERILTSVDTALAELDMKRRILELHTGPHECPTPEDNCGWTDGKDPCETVRLLGLPYVGSPDYQQEWKP